MDVKLAIYHCDAKIISRRKGSSVVAAAAYRAGEKLQDLRYGVVHDYLRKQRVGHSEILAPEAAPDWVFDREALWNEVEQIEKRSDAQLAREFTIALPKELSPAQNIQLAREICQTLFVARGMVADMNLHDLVQDNPHLHVLLSTRSIGVDGFGLKNRNWNKRALLVEFRFGVADIINQHLHQAGFATRIDARSLADRGIDIQPGIHLGPELHAAWQRGERAAFDKVQDHLAIMAENGRRICAEPTLALKKLSQQHATFTELEIAKCANCYSANLEQFQAVRKAIHQCPELVVLGRNARGELQFTSLKVLKQEQQLLVRGLDLAAREKHGVAEGRWQRSLQDYLQQQQCQLNSAQLRAFNYLMQAGDLKCVVGLAGTGKSFLMAACHQAWLDAGFEVKGAALTGKAAQGLQADAEIESHTLDSWLLKWQQGQECLHNRCVLVLDECGMVGTEHFNRLLHHIEASDAKLVLVGDPEQTQPFAAGNPTQALLERVPHVRLDTVVRQQDPSCTHSTEQMQTATQEFGSGQPEQALQRYKSLGAMQDLAITSAEAKKTLIEHWFAERDTGNQICLAQRNQDVRDLNLLARQKLIDNGQLDAGQWLQITTRQGVESRHMAVQEQVYFSHNAMLDGVAVKNGSLGTVLAIEKDTLSVQLKDSAQLIQFSLQDYAYLDYGYAATIHKAQGLTVDKTYLLSGNGLDRHLSYVACSRHRQELKIYASKDEFANHGAMINSMSRANSKSLALEATVSNTQNQDPRVTAMQVPDKSIGEWRAYRKSRAGKVWDAAKQQLKSLFERLDEPETNFDALISTYQSYAHDTMRFVRGEINRVELNQTKTQAMAAAFEICQHPQAETWVLSLSGREQATVYQLATLHHDNHPELSFAPVAAFHSIQEQRPGWER